jgi:hypothetical protein
MSWLRLLSAILLLSAGALLAACAAEDAATAGRMPLPGAGRAAFFVVVGRDHSVDRIAQTYGVKKHDIIAANNLVPPYRLQPGSLLEVPVDTANRVRQAKRAPNRAVAAKTVIKRSRAASAEGRAGKSKAKKRPRIAAAANPFAERSSMVSAANPSAPTPQR